MIQRSRYQSVSRFLLEKIGSTALKKAAIIFLKLAVPAALFVYLLARVEPEHYRAFWEQPKRWHLILAAQFCAIIAIVLGILRWRWLVRAFDIPFSIVEALRIGFLGYLLNFVSFGSVGGDVFKAILVAKDKPDRRPEAVASVLLDRSVGLLGLVILTCASLFAFSGTGLPAVLVLLRNWMTGLLVLASSALMLAIFSGAWFERLLNWVSGWPLIGETLARMARAVRMLRGQPQTLISVIVVSVAVHSLLAFSIYLISCGVYPSHPSLVDHLKIVPPGLAVGAIPLAPGGLGYQEAALANLFATLPDMPEEFSGMLVATIFRLITLTIAGIGLMYYLFSHRREFQLAKDSASLAKSQQ